jgi:hypothetical protein
MTTLNIEMPLVKNCSVQECAFNTDQYCHAKAITIGDGSNPACDTFFEHASHATKNRNAGVGACKVESCQFNKNFDCTAVDISVGEIANTVRCLTYLSQ